MFCRLLFVCSSFFFWPLYCLSFSLPFLITSLISSVGAVFLHARGVACTHLQLVKSADCVLDLGGVGNTPQRRNCRLSIHQFVLVDLLKKFSFLAWYKYFNEKWWGKTSFIDLHIPSMMRSCKCFPRAIKIPTLT